MDLRQNNNTLNWVEAMLSDEYRHCPVDLYDYHEDRYSAFGVVLDLAGHCRVNKGLFVDMKPVLWKQTLDQRWFDNRFGVNLEVSFLRDMNDLAENYYAVCAHLLNRCLPGERQHNLFRNLRELANAPV